MVQLAVIYSGELRAQTGGEDIIGNGWTISLIGARRTAMSLIIECVPNDSR